MASDTPKAPPSSLPLNLLTSLDVAELLGKSDTWVERECRAGRMPHTKAGRSYRFTTADVDTYLASHRPVSS